MEFKSNMEMDQATGNILNDADRVSHWDWLPHHILLEIYFNLDIYDQCSMSLASLNWEEVFNCPQLWRQIYFPLFPNRELCKFEPAMKEKCLIEKCGHMVKHLTVRNIFTCQEHILFRNNAPCSCAAYKEERDNLVLLLSKAQLESLTFEKFVGSKKFIHMLLEMQKSVLNFEIKDGEINFRDIRVLDSWKNQLKRFGMYEMEDFVSYIVNEEEFESLWKSILHIEEVEIVDCGRLSELLLDNFHNYVNVNQQTQDMKLKYLKITRCAYKKFTASNKPIKSWELIAFVRQSLEVKLQIFADCKKIKDITRLLPPPVVLRNLSIENEEKDCESLNSLLRHLLDEGYNKTLNEFRIKWNLKGGDSDLFKGFIRRCPMLKISEITNC